MNSDPENQKWNGYILFLPFAKGSKSESIRPFLVCDRNEVHLLFVSGDNPFENNSLIEYHKYYCDISGKYDSEKKLIFVNKIEVQQDPQEIKTTNN